MTRAALRAQHLAQRLPDIYPDAHCELDYRTPLELLVATILSAQCTDKRVNIVTKDLFARCETARDFADISQEELETIIRSTGFYRNKAKNIRAMAAVLLEKYGGEVPRTLKNSPPSPAWAAKRRMSYSGMPSASTRAWSSTHT